MARYGNKAKQKVKKAMHEKKRGKLRSGSGKKVKSRKQAIAIGLSEARREGGKVPKKKSSSRKGSASSKSRKRSTKSSGRKSSSGRKTSSGRKSSRKSSGRKTTSKKSGARKKK